MSHAPCLAYRHAMKATARGTLLGAFRFAARGVLDAALLQRNMRLHLVASVLVAAFASAVPLGPGLACTFGLHAVAPGLVLKGWRSGSP